MLNRRFSASKRLRQASLLSTALLATTIASAGCNKKSSGKDKGPAATSSAAAGAVAQTDEELNAVLATINGTTITVREFQDRINRQSPYIRARYSSIEQKKEFLDNLIRFEVLAQEAKRKGLDKDPDVVRTMKQVMIQKLMKDLFENSISPEDVTDQEMQAYYEANHGEFNKPEEVRVSAIILSKKAEATKVAELALGDKGKTNKGFRELVAQYTVDEETKKRGGDLRYFAATTEEYPKAVVEAAFKLAKTGDVAGPIKGNDGRFYIIKQTGHRKAVVKTFEQVKRQLQNRLYRDKRNDAQKDFVKGLRDAAQIEINDANLGKVKIDTSTKGGGNGGHGAHGAPGAHGMGLPAMAPDPATPEATPSAPEASQ